MSRPKDETVKEDGMNAYNYPYYKFMEIGDKIFDTICHEHLGFFSSKVIIEMIKKTGLKVFHHEYNNINGGSSRYYISHKKANYKVKSSIKKVLLKIYQDLLNQVHMHVL